MASLNPADFIRANKQFILARNSVTDITIWFDNRLLVTLDVETPERIYISMDTHSRLSSRYRYFYPLYKSMKLLSGQ